MSLFRRTFTVHPLQVALLNYRGKPAVVLGPGRHRLPRGAQVDVVDLRQQHGALATQEVMTDDGLSVKVSVEHLWRVDDPMVFTRRSTDPLAVVYLGIQVALREVVAARSVEDLAGASRTTLSAAVLAAARARAAEVGVELDQVVVRDVVLPPEYRQARADLVIGRHRAQAQLEAARAQTAALRSLANGAKLLDDHPALARLRLVEALPPGAEVQLVMPVETAT